MPDNAITPVIHDLKCWPEFFWPLMSGEKPFEIRTDDRGYQIGHYLREREYDPQTQTYSGQSGLFLVTYMTDFGQPEGQVVMAVRRVSDNQVSSLGQILGRVSQNIGDRIEIKEG